jgi:hypothetical protein
MTLEQINALTKEDVLEVLLSRMGLENDPDDGSVELELDIYKQEIIDALEEKERIKNWKQRIRQVKDINYVMRRLGYTKPNSLKEALDKVGVDKAEQWLIDIEAESIVVENEKQAQATEDATRRNLKANAQQRLNDLKMSDVNNIADVKNVLKDIVVVLKEN